MAYKKLTNKGKEFIRAVCSGTGNSLLSGTKTYALPYSNDPAGTIYTVTAQDHSGNTITTNEQLGEALIYWFDEYSKLYALDANIIAAQCYVESSYIAWNYAGGTSSAQGLAQFLSSTMYDIVIGNLGAANDVTIGLFSEEEKDLIRNGLTNPNSQDSYVYKDNNLSFATAKANRVPLFQNIINNPQISIKAQCRFMKGISTKAANNAASTLFGYNQGYDYVRENYIKTVRVADNALSRARRDEGLNYVKRVFNILNKKVGEKVNGSLFSFGYELDGSFDTFTAEVKSSPNTVATADPSLRLSKDYILGDLIRTSTGIPNNPTNEEVASLRNLAQNVLQPITDLIGKKLIINSGFRSELVNRKVGGVSSSQHQQAEAADVRVQTNDPNELRTIFDQIIASDISYDQIIFENKDNALNKWIHITYESDGQNRKDKKLANYDTANRKWIYTDYVV